VRTIIDEADVGCETAVADGMALPDTPDSGAETL
jgi:hypothetical protein